MPQKWIRDQVPLKWTKLGKIVGTGTRICHSILSISVALGLLLISVAFVMYINFIGTSSIYMHIYIVRFKSLNQLESCGRFTFDWLLADFSSVSYDEIQPCCLEGTG